MERVDAISCGSGPDAMVYLHGEAADLHLLEAAWIMLDHHVQQRISTVPLTSAAVALVNNGYCNNHDRAYRYVLAAERWTGNVVAGEIR
jgi:hypothetical protein